MHFDLSFCHVLGCISLRIKSLRSREKASSIIVRRRRCKPCLRFRACVICVLKAFHASVVISSLFFWKLFIISPMAEVDDRRETLVFLFFTLTTSSSTSGKVAPRDHHQAQHLEEIRLVFRSISRAIITSAPVARPCDPAPSITWTK